MRRFFYIFGALLLLTLLFFQGCRGLSRTIYNSMDCDRFNIDHIELRTGINIPSVTRLDCQIEDNQRIAEFDVHISGEDKEQYIRRYFKWNGMTYYAQGKDPNTEWSASYDTLTNRLQLQLDYH